MLISICFKNYGSLGQLNNSICIHYCRLYAFLLGKFKKIEQKKKNKEKQDFTDLNIELNMKMIINEYNRTYLHRLHLNKFELLFLSFNLLNASYLYGC